MPPFLGDGRKDIEAGPIWAIWLSPTLAALTGIIVMRSFPYSPFFMIAGTFAVVAAQLKILRSDVFPSLSAAILPIITHADSWLYTLSVCSTVFPYIAVFATEGAARTIYCIVIVLQLLHVADCARFHGTRSRYAVGLAPTTLLFCWIILRTTVLNLVRGGIYWRGTFYPLKELKSNVV